MANNFSSTEKALFEKITIGFDSNDIVTRTIPDYKIADGSVRHELTEWRPVPQISRTVSGRDITGQFRDITERLVPVNISENDIENVPFQLNAVEYKDSSRLDRKAASVSQALSALLERKVRNEIVMKGSLVSTGTGGLKQYADFAPADSIMLERGIPESEARSMAIPVRTWNTVTGNLAERANFNKGATQDAFSRNQLPMIAGFDSFRVDNTARLTGYAGGAITVAGAQSHVPAPNGGPDNRLQDNRTMVWTVNATAGLKAGDAFSVAGVNAVHNISKEDTGEALTCRVYEVLDGTTFVGTAVVNANGPTQPEKEFGNATSGLPAGAALIFLNVNDDTPTIFYRNDAIELVHTGIADDHLTSSMAVMTAETANGYKVSMYRDGEINDLSAKYRYTMWAKPQVLDYEQCGILLGNQ